MTIIFYACTKCGSIVDLSGDIMYYQSKPHNYFWDAPAKCDGYLTVPSTQETWEKANGRPYPAELLTKFQNVV